MDKSQRRSCVRCPQSWWVRPEAVHVLCRDCRFVLPVEERLLWTA